MIPGLSHLSDEQLSALLDDQLPATGRAAADAHLAGCEACRVRLADLSALDQSLGKALAHDPGESYFADFADRVARRIATPDAAPEAPRAQTSAPKASTSVPKAGKFWSWLVTPRGLALAGSTAALLVTAGIAWMRFGDVAYAPPRVAAPRMVASPQAPLRESDEARPQEQSPPAARAPATPQGAEGTRPDATIRSFAASPGEQTARAQQLKTLPNGEQVPVERPQEKGGAPARQEAQGNALAAPATGSAIAQMKRRSVAPAADATAPAPGAAASLSKEEAATGANKDAKQDANKGAAPPAEAQLSARDAAPPPARAPKPVAVAPPAATQLNAFSTDTARGRSFYEWSGSKSLKGPRVDEAKVNANVKLPSLAANCGKVRDSRGRELAGAQVTAVRNGVRTARTGPDGSFCIDGLKAGDTLTVMHVGFDPYTVVMTPMTSLAITLEPVGTLGPNATMLTGKAQTPPPPQSLSGALRATAPPADSAPRPDVYADQSSGVRQLVRDAREATAIARRERTAPSFENAAKRWAAVLGQVKGAPAHDAGFQYVAALREAYQLEPTSERGGRLRSAMAAFLATAPASLPERATVARWQSELNAPSDR